MAQLDNIEGLAKKKKGAQVRTSGLTKGRAARIINELKSKN
jgi:hypothetical protein